ncbi:PH (Pleckstrin Homology) domain-containing protein [Kribbella sp. VKM Ac-2527]|uniref:PH (Pleckstrin Homology) domain-containing protein n=1 Tax=Kribbella caucasensis TaxID=2512215 RepID=A0A4R6K6D0_9ACTN|nr:PH domain-containing protein [Kribbella sp. VKM Ac-2527]TDO44102.1 PH (Pleckstrin Homology) domain-containing protein [Kribbella sp. VKM Ac-2527]
MKPKVSENEQYLSQSNRITGAVVMLIGLVGLIDIVIEWRTMGGLLVSALIGILMVLTYVGLFRPSVTLRPDGLLIRNHVRDHQVPWNLITDVDVTDILRVHTGEDAKIRCPGVQVVMKDMRKQRVGGRKLGAENSITRADFVVDRIENHRERYASTADPDAKIVTSWAKPELYILAALVVVGVLAQFLR